MLKRVNERLRENDLTINVEKSVSPTTSLKFLGYILSSDGIKTDPTLVEKIKNIPKPSDQKQLVSFLGLANYYGRFVENFAGICQSLYELKKKEEFSWSPSSDKSFNMIKERLISAPVLQPFALLKHSVLTVDASEKSITRWSP